MAATPKFGAALGSDELTTKVELDSKVEVATWRDKTGTTAHVKDYDPTTEISVEIEGDARTDFEAGVLSTLPVESGAGITGGVTIAPSVKYSETNEGKAVTSITATHYPSAAVVS